MGRCAAQSDSDSGAPGLKPLSLLAARAQDEGTPQDALGFVAHVEVPDQDAIKRAVLARRKAELLGKLGAGGGSTLVEHDVEVAEKSRLPPSW